MMMLMEWYWIIALSTVIFFYKFWLHINGSTSALPPRSQLVLMLLISMLLLLLTL